MHIIVDKNSHTFTHTRVPSHSHLHVQVQTLNMMHTHMTHISNVIHTIAGDLRDGTVVGGQRRGT